MFGVLTDKFQDLFSKLSAKKTLSEENLVDAVRDVRMALLDADVNYTVASNFQLSRRNTCVLSMNLCPC